MTLKKLLVIQPIKKDYKKEKGNYRPIRILPNLSKIQERLLYDQMYAHSSTFFLTVNVAIGIYCTTLLLSND